MAEGRRIMAVPYSHYAKEQSRLAGQIEANNTSIQEAEALIEKLKAEKAQLAGSLNAVGLSEKDIKSIQDRLATIERDLIENVARVDACKAENEAYKTDQYAARHEDLQMTKLALGGPGKGKMKN